MATICKLLLLCLLVGACTGDVTRPGPSAQPQEITRYSPTANSVGVAVTTEIRVTFASPVELPLDTAGAFWLESGGDPLIAKVSASDSSLVLTPVDILDVGSVHTAHVGPGITRNGVPVEEVTWSFTTGGAVVPPPSPARIATHIYALAADSMEGRPAGSPEELKAAEYLRAEFVRYGLSAVPGNDWLQVVPSDGFMGNSQNVIGYVPGAGDLVNEWLIVGAHYDAQGVANGVVLNGADDNASGTAAMLEAARLLAKHAAIGGFGSPHRRNIAFIGFGAEEEGMVGSYWFCRAQPLVPMEQLIAMINLDMVGRLRDNTLILDGLASASEWAPLLDRYDPGLTFASAFFYSDHRCFSQVRHRPVLAFHTGTHSNYHQPTDDAALINFQGIVTVTDLVLELATNLAIRPWPLTQ